MNNPPVSDPGQPSVPVDQPSVPTDQPTPAPVEPVLPDEGQPEPQAPGSEVPQQPEMPGTEGSGEGSGGAAPVA